VRQQKHRIVALLKLLGVGAADKAGYEEVVQQSTGLALLPALYPDIIERLEARVTERLRTRAARGGKRTGVASAVEVRACETSVTRADADMDKARA